MKKQKKEPAFLPSLRTDTVVLEDGRRATVYGCGKILSYSDGEICVSVGKNEVVLQGTHLICASFCGGALTVTGNLRGIFRRSGVGNFAGNAEERI